jgi:release factor glutamine methyltransferase
MKINEIYKRTITDLSSVYTDNPRIEAEILIRHTVGFSRKDFILKKDSDEFPDTHLMDLEALVKKRLSGKSIAEITNKKDFFDSEFYVNENVLIPRPETELILEVCVEKFNMEKKFNLLEIGIGSGIISIIFARYFSQAIIDALDISQEALDVAKINIEKNMVPGERINLIQADFFKFKTDKQYDLLLSNPPYIPSKDAADLISSKKISDPIIALDGGKDGLDFYRKIKDFSESNLKPGGFLIVEHGMHQRRDISKILSDEMFEKTYFDDYAGIDRVILAQKRKLTL